MSALAKNTPLDQETIDYLRMETQWLIADKLAKQDLFQAAKAVRDVRVRGHAQMDLPGTDTCTHDQGIKRLAAKLEHAGWLLEKSNPGTHLRLEIERERNTLHDALATILAPDSHQRAASDIIFRLVREAHQARETAPCQ